MVMQRRQEGVSEHAGRPIYRLSRTPKLVGLRFPRVQPPMDRHSTHTIATLGVRGSRGGWRRHRCNEAPSRGFRKTMPAQRATAMGDHRAIDVDVPELVGARSLIGRAALAVDGRPRGAEIGQQGIDGMVVERIDLAPGELGRLALRVPACGQARHDHRLLDPGRPAGVRRPPGRSRSASSPPAS
jgi:hypothetical protein